MNSKYEDKIIISEVIGDCIIIENSKTSYTVYTDHYRLINMETKKFVTPMLTKLSDFINIDGVKLASFEISLPYCSKTINPKNYLYGVIDEFGNLVGPVVDFKTKEAYLVSKYNEDEIIKNDGTKIHNFDNLIEELSALEESYTSIINRERNEYMNQHKQLIYKKD